jgi:hypothetical protein
MTKRGSDEVYALTLTLSLVRGEGETTTSPKMLRPASLASSMTRENAGNTLTLILSRQRERRLGGNVGLWPPRDDGLAPPPEMLRLPFAASSMTERKTFSETRFARMKAKYRDDEDVPSVLEGGVL